MEYMTDRHMVFLYRVENEQGCSPPPSELRETF